MYRFKTENELEHFELGEAVVGDIQFMEGLFEIVLDQVKILPENSQNKDIRTMRTNELLFTILEPEDLKIIEEGMRTYDANGVLKTITEDKILAPSEYNSLREVLPMGNIYEVVKKECEKGFRYQFVIDGTDEKTYSVEISGKTEWMQWNRFMSVE